MRTQSAAQAKGIKSGHTQLRPREGTHLREVYDLLQANKAAPVTIPPRTTSPDKGAVLESLRNFYGLDVRPFREVTPTRSTRPGPPRKRYWLVGEWFGRTYMDYLADARAAQKRAQRG